MRSLILLLAVASVANADALSDIVGPVTAYGTSPWTYYDSAEEGNAVDIATAALANTPRLGSVLSCTGDLTSIGPPIITATCASEAAPVVISAATSANPVVLTLASTAPAYLVVGGIVTISGATGCTSLNGDMYISAVSGTSVTVRATYSWWTGCIGTPYTASSGQVNDQLVIGWNSVEGAGAGRWWINAVSVSGTTITGVGNLFNTTTGAQTGVTLYHCTQCSGDTAKYQQGWWGGGNVEVDNSWNFYDAGLALYQRWRRSGVSADLTTFRDYVDLWWTWPINSGGRENIYAPRNISFVSQYVRALDGQSQRFPGLYAMVKNNYDFNNIINPTTSDTRESGYMLIFLAVGARADPDDTRHASYCLMLSTIAQHWLDIYSTSHGASLGFFLDKAGPYSLEADSFSPWRDMFRAQGFARAYDVLNDTTSEGCDDTALAADLLANLEITIPNAYSLGHDTVDRGIYYHVGSAAWGTDGGFTLGTGTVDVTTTTAVVGHGTNFTTAFSPCDGSKFISVEDPVGNRFPYRVTACADDTHLTIAAAWGTQCTWGYAGIPGTLTQNCPGTESGKSYLIVQEAWGCNSTATDCIGSTGDINSNRDMLWIMGWMYKTTADAQYKTMGDENMAVSSGGPGDGPGGSAACAGPNCSDTETDYIIALHGCGFASGVPCNSASNHTCKETNGQCEDPNPCPTTGCFSSNVYVDLRSKRYAQMSGIGGADNYLSWRLGGASSTGVSSISGKIQFSGKVVIY